jgi:hypothetical protein
MTIKMNDLVFAPFYVDDTWLPAGDNVPYSDYNVLSLVRHIWRDRSDITQHIVINGVTTIATPNEYGHDIFIDVTYSKRGWRATYAGKSGSTITNFTCYMD